MKVAFYYITVLAAVMICIFVAEKFKRNNKKVLYGFFCMILFLIVLLFV